MDASLKRIHPSVRGKEIPIEPIERTNFSLGPPPGWHG
jgi:hypothetical protein